MQKSHRATNLALHVAFVLAAGAPLTSTATHIVGGEIYYECLGSNNYRITLNVYRDCYLGRAAYDNPAAIGIFNASNALVQTVYVAFPGSTELTPVAPAPCVIIPSNVCVEVATYVTTVNLPPIPGGYRLAYQRCCRNQTIVNITSPGGTGATYTTTIPDASAATCNNSPVFTAWPPVFVCSGMDLSFNHAATDADADSLVYELCTPLRGATSGNPRPQPPGAPPYTSVTWQGSYGVSNQVGGTPALTINTQTGALTGLPPASGQYVVGVCVKEYRNGNLISTTQRDFQFNVLQCDEDVVIAISSATVNCANLTVQFTNSSTGACGYQWDFGDPNSTTDNSTATSPSWTYTSPGSYTVNLVAESCSDPACNDTLTNYVALADTCQPCAMTLSMAQNNASCTGGAGVAECGKGVRAESFDAGTTRTYKMWVRIGTDTALVTCTVPCANCSSSSYTLTCPPNGSGSASGCTSTGSSAWCETSCGSCGYCGSGGLAYMLCGADTVYSTYGGVGSISGLACVTAYLGSGGQSYGDATATPTGGTSPYTYTWSNGLTTQTAGGLTQGTYSVTVNDANLCQAISSVVITVADGDITLTMSKTDVTACSGTDGTATVSASGGGPSYEYVWSPGGQTTATITGLGTGTYSVLVDITGGSSCPVSGSVTVNEPNSVSVTPSGSALDCAGDCGGTVSLSVSGGTSPYSYQWYPTNGSTSSTMTGRCTGSYAYTVTDDNGCIETGVATVTSPSAITATASSAAVACYAGSTGSATASPTGGTPGYNYSWPNGATGVTATGLSAGTYTVTVSDANSCQTTATVTVSQPDPLGVELENTSAITCGGAFTGELTADVTGGTAGEVITGTEFTEPFTYTNGTNALCEGVYTWTTDGSGLGTSVDYFEVNSNIFRAADLDGEGIWYSMVVDISGCTSVSISVDYQECGVMESGDYIRGYYKINGGGETQFFNLTDDGATNCAVNTGTAAGLSGSTIQIVIRMFNGDGTETHYFDNVQILCDGSPIYTEDFSTYSNGAAKGTCTVLPETWSVSTSGCTLASGDWFEVTGSRFEGKDLDCGAGSAVWTTKSFDISGCECVTVSADFGISGVMDAGEFIRGYYSLDGGGDVLWVDHTGCDGCVGTCPTGQEFASPSPGCPPECTSTSTSGGICTCNGCSGLGADVGGWPDGAPSSDTSSCISGSTLVLKVKMQNTGASDIHYFDNIKINCVTQYAYLWCDGQTNRIATGLAAGTCTVTVTDGNSCAATSELTIADPGTISLSTTSTDVCNGASDGTATVTPSGGTAPYTYLWCGGQTTQTVSNLSQGGCGVTVTDANTCTSNTSVTINNAGDVSGSGVKVDGFNCDYSDGSIDITVSGGTPPYSYTWNDGATSEDRTNIPAGPYTVVIWDSNNCSDPQSFTVNCTVGLPIELLHFDAVLRNGVTQLEWMTASETNNSHFDVERSADGTDFTPLLTMPGAGNSQTVRSYGAFDLGPLKGISYYRLRQTDYDGSFSLTPAVAVNNSGGGRGFELISLYPNPATHFLNYSLRSPLDGFVWLEITDIAGRKVVSREQKLEEGVNSLSLDISWLTGGAYQFSIITGEVVLSKSLYVK